VFHVKHDSHAKVFDVVVIGAGHAGCEAAAAAARCGAKTSLLTKAMTDIGVLSCNPAIGGLGKGQIVREIDAMDGLMGRMADRAAIQFRMLNRSRGAATRGPRAQIDRTLYARAMQDELFNYPNLTLSTGLAIELILEHGRLAGVRLANGGSLHCRALVLTSGTFLRGVIHIGKTRMSAGRYGEPPSDALGVQLEQLGLPVGRLKTGTPARLDRRTIDWASLERQPGDATPEPFSFLTAAIVSPQIDCHITRTTPETHAVVAGALEDSPMFSGAITGRGPRYCPSIEDKVTRFSDRDNHQIFLEPEGFDSDLIYPNGISSSLGEDTQRRMIRTIPGLHAAEIVRPGYAIEYDYFDPRGLLPTLQCKTIPGLFLAGQVNGTTGYEEAGGQGLIAGVNAARNAAGLDASVVKRSDGFIGVMIDDLTSLGVTEPYRMFTSRAEFRLSLRADNADLRLTPLGIQLGCVSEVRQESYRQREAAVRTLRDLLGTRMATPNEARSAGIHVNSDGVRRSALDLLSRPDVTFSDLERLWPDLRSVPAGTRGLVEIDATYSVYLERQQRSIDDYTRNFDLALSEDLDYLSIPGLSNEVKVRLNMARPLSLEHAQRLEGITPAAITLLAAYVRKRRDAAA
jgi:tRNA uridine 5-carboxymethylaminomethyl modification enzyme